MKTLLSSLALVLLLTSPVSADNVFLDAGVGLFKSESSGALFLRYQKETSQLLRRPSYWEGVAGYWTGDNSALTLGIARGINWNLAKRDHYFSTTFGVLGVSRTTEHLGTHFQFYFREAFHIKLRGADVSLGLTHISNGKAVFGWNGPNSGENFVNLAVGFM